MKIRDVLIGSFFVLAIHSTATAQDADVDWKVFGGAKINDESTCFFDSKGIVNLPAAHKRVWTKCVLQNKLDSVNISKEMGGKIKDTVVKKIMTGYVSPFANVMNMDDNQKMATAMYEEIANQAGLESQVKILYEIDCQGQKTRNLQMTINAEGKTKSFGETEKWDYVAPETNASRLMKMVCR